MISGQILDGKNIKQAVNLLQDVDMRKIQIVESYACSVTEDRLNSIVCMNHSGSWIIGDGAYIKNALPYSIRYVVFSKSSANSVNLQFGTLASEGKVIISSYNNTCVACAIFSKV